MKLQTLTHIVLGTLFMGLFPKAHAVRLQMVATQTLQRQKAARPFLA